jgi:hypothetical protein
MISTTVSPGFASSVAPERFDARASPLSTRL